MLGIRLQMFLAVNRLHINPVHVENSLKTQPTTARSELMCVDRYHRR